ncbi:MAG: hypothetical protein JSU63_21885 [Phycisphaerales bacterium]|nr:MAG: hypothetical protein JSU63_21885 [Phycisphaerales bacterium]
MSHSRKNILAPRQPMRLDKHRDARRRRLPQTAFIAVGLTLLMGCANNPISRWFSNRQNERHDQSSYTYDQSDSSGESYTLANSSVDPDHTLPYSHDKGNGFDQPTAVNLSRTYGQTSSIQDYFTHKAEKNHLPQKYISEARIGMTDVDVILNGARATELDRDATFRRRSAQLSNKRTNAAANEEVSLAEIHEARRQQEAKRMELTGQLSARARQLEALDEKNARLADAWAKEQRTVQQEVISQAEQESDEAMAGIEQLGVIRDATEAEAFATISQLRSNARATRTRAEANIAQLRQEALAVSEKTAAKVGELTSKLATVPIRFNAEASRLETHASSVQARAFAKAEELKARASATETQAAEHEFNLMVSVARTNRQQVEAEAELRYTEADTNYERGIIEVERMRADAHMTIQNSQSEATRRSKELDAWFQRSMAEVDLMRSTADRDEKIARAEFVKVVAKHTADAMRETNEHQQVLSEAQMKATIAEAETKAAEVHEQIMNELEYQTRIGGVGFAGKTTPTDESMDLDVPVSEKVMAIAPNINPEDIAKFQSSLAKVLHTRTSADAQFSSLGATYNERKTAVESERDQGIAVGTEQLAASDAMQLELDAAMEVEKASVMANLEAGRMVFDSAIVEAEAFRRNALADVSELRALAKATLDDGAARSQAFRKEAQVVRDNGQEEIEAIQAELRSTEEQGEAESNRFLAEANSIEKGKTALAKQIDAQIIAAEQELVADLSNLDRRIESGTTIAETNYYEMLAQAESLGLQTEMEIKRMAGRNAFERALAQAEIERVHDMNFLEGIMDEAQIDRRMAVALADRSNSDALNDAEQVAIQAQADTFSAEVDAQRRIAAARASTVNSLFNTRVVEVDSDRIKEKADALVKASRERANAETILAEAEAAREKTRERLARLVKHQASLQRAAVTDWDSRLAKNSEQGFSPQ